MAVLVALALLFSSRDNETARMQAHLARVEADLRASDAARLTAAQRRWRARLLDELHRYWTRGRFPSNTFLLDRTPIFVDRSGTRCAVAHLIEISGHGDLVAAVAASHNTAYVAELGSDRELAGWLDEHGLTAAEAARIQPSYEPFPAGTECSIDDDRASGRCINLHPRYGYCTETCGEDGSCPLGPYGTPMECDPYGPGYLCLYPTPAPGDF